MQPISHDVLHMLTPEELHIIEEIPAAEIKLDQLFQIAGVKSQEASQALLDSVDSHLPDPLQRRKEPHRLTENGHGNDDSD
ncbi:hypothetical protein CgunFtcFv8_009020 [Champsocephalus gunnari]|uniref:Uncharacterized protein n=1 Tax=Champsocephalus gunnari TaxID=52237 RepID=A0AAN8D501_CHAGU|nr:hypothetical protein CgunFtcFv8_009020 [Champsocephalus gunnari]